MLSLPPAYEKPGLASLIRFGGLMALLAAVSSPASAQEVVIGRNAEGRISIRAVRVTEPIEIDGNLDEAVYRDVEPISDFIQQIPDEGCNGLNCYTSSKTLGKLTIFGELPKTVYR